MIKVPDKVQKFIVTGFSAALVNILLMLFFVEVLNYKTHMLKNIANILAIMLSIIYNFIVCRLWTWNNIFKKQGKALVRQFALFNVVNFITMSMRAILFAWMDKAGVFYLVNVVFGIILAAAISFVLYDKIVFKS